MKKVMTILLAGVVMAATSLPAFSREYEGHTFAEKIYLNTQLPSLLLNGVATRKKFFFDIYYAALYLDEISNDADAILQSSGPKRMHIKFEYKVVSKKKLSAAWRASLEKNLSEERYKEIQTDLEKFIAAHDEEYLKGDTLTIDFLPGVGTKLVSKNVEKLVLPGAQLFTALLHAWIGKAPPSKAFKRDVLGAEQ